jgi:hypothetical protein
MHAASDFREIVNDVKEGEFAKWLLSFSRTLSIDFVGIFGIANQSVSQSSTLYEVIILGYTVHFWDNFRNANLCVMDQSSLPEERTLLGLSSRSQKFLIVLVHKEQNPG